MAGFLQPNLTEVRPRRLAEQPGRARHAEYSADADGRQQHDYSDVEKVRVAAHSGQIDGRARETNSRRQFELPEQI